MVAPIAPAASGSGALASLASPFLGGLGDGLGGQPSSSSAFSSAEVYATMNSPFIVGGAATHSSDPAQAIAKQLPLILVGAVAWKLLSA